jgi:hypothetical protein
LSAVPLISRASGNPEARFAGAIANYRQALELRPGFKEAAEALKELVVK